MAVENSGTQTNPVKSSMFRNVAAVQTTGRSRAALIRKNPTDTNAASKPESHAVFPNTQQPLICWVQFYSL